MNRLIKLIGLILIFSFLFCGAVSATIERDSTKKKSGDIRRNITPGDFSDKAGSPPDGRVKRNRPQGYDDFVDKNGNGIDDRAEQKQDGSKKDNSPGVSESKLQKIQNSYRKTNHRPRSPDDSVVKLKNR